MRPEWLWDKDISTQEIQSILKDPDHERFVPLAALVLSRSNAPKEVFDGYLDRLVFVRHWGRIKRHMRKNSWNDPRIVFWQAVYEKLAEDFKRQGVVIRPTKKEPPRDGLSASIAGEIRKRRQELSITQAQLAQRIGISQQIVSRIEKGRDDMRLLTLEKIAQGLGRTVSIEFR